MRPEADPREPSVDEPPRVSFLLITYRQELFVREALESALSQDYGNLEVIVSDDNSPDRTFELVTEILSSYTGPHQVSAVQNAVNMGPLGNVNAAMTLVRGELVVAAAGDDISLPERTRFIVDEYLRSGRRAKAIFSNAIVIDQAGRKERNYYSVPPPSRLSLTELASSDAGLLGCTQAWTTELFDIFGPIDPNVTREDAVIPFRASLLGHVAYLDLPLVQYRHHSNNIQFGSPHEVRHRRQLYEGLHRHSTGNIAVVEARLADICRLRLLQEGGASLDEAEAATSRLLKEKILEERLLSAGRVGQALTIWEGLRSQVPRRRLIRWTLLAFSPATYLWYQRRLSAGDEVDLAFSGLK